MPWPKFSSEKVGCAQDLILEGKFTRKGISPPEFVGDKEGCYDAVMKYLGERNVFCKKQVVKKKELVA